MCYTKGLIYFKTASIFKPHLFLRYVASAIPYQRTKLCCVIKPKCYHYRRVRCLQRTEKSPEHFCLQKIIDKYNIFVRVCLPCLKGGGPRQWWRDTIAENFNVSVFLNPSVFLLRKNPALLQKRQPFCLLCRHFPYKGNFLQGKGKPLVCYTKVCFNS